MSGLITFLVQGNILPKKIVKTVVIYSGKLPMKNLPIYQTKLKNIKKKKEIRIIKVLKLGQKY